jgi:hypothetical protein
VPVDALEIGDDVEGQHGEGEGEFDDVCPTMSVIYSLIGVLGVIRE